jgi:ribosomal 30S subunit maturation factor RimM
MALRPLSRVDDFSFPEGAYDVRGWRVRTAVDEEKVGRVEDMLLDHAGELRFVDVDLGFLKKHILVPLDRAHADRESETVWIHGVRKEHLEEAPEYALDPATLDEGYERRLAAYFGASREAPHTTDPTPQGTGPLELHRLSEMEDDYRVAGEDPRGWKVITGEGETVGRVVELLVAPGDMKARYLDVTVDEKRLELEPVDRHILVPAEHVRLDRSANKVVVAGLLAHDFGEYPQYGGLPLEREHARHIHDYFGRLGTSEVAETDDVHEREGSRFFDGPSTHPESTRKE